MAEGGLTVMGETKGWRALRIVLAVLIFVAGVAKLAGRMDMIADLGIPLDFIPLIGAFEIVNAVLFLWPRTAFYGGAFQTLVLIVAVSAHAASADWTGIWGALVLGVLVGVTAWRIRPRAIR